MRTVNAAQRAAKREALLDAAAQCFAERGYEATRTADICAVVGMSSGNLFHYFRTKHDVLLALVEREGTQTAAFLAELGAECGPFDALLGLLEAVCEMAADPVAGGLALEISAQAHRDEDVALRYKANDRSFRDGLAGLVRAADAAGEIRTDLTPEAAATWLAALVDGVFARVEADPDFRPAEQSAVLRRLVTHLLREGGV
ncbi:TetR/AcrR family transcriptional regulator [Streptomyces tsukubensis]|uniref:TetR/AcrR family transcriptional regulator n=1 Tax=Streptomyces tsukubensis TaxID=83656 RepID=UPI00344C5B9E